MKPEVLSLLVIEESKTTCLSTTNHNCFHEDHDISVKKVHRPHGIALYNSFDTIAINVG